MKFRLSKTSMFQSGRMAGLVRRARLCGREDGQALVEFSLVLPLLLLIVTGILGLGIVMNQFEILTNAVSVGARAFAFSRQMSLSDPCAYAVTAMTAAAPTLDSSNMTVTITKTSAAGVVSTYSNSCSGDLVLEPDIGGSVTMKVVYPMSTIVFGWNGKVLNLTAQTAEQIQ